MDITATNVSCRFEPHKYQQAAFEVILKHYSLFNKLQRFVAVAKLWEGESDATQPRSPHSHFEKRASEERGCVQQSQQICGAERPSRTRTGSSRQRSTQSIHFSAGAVLRGARGRPLERCME